MPIESSLLQKPKKLSVQLALIVCTFGTGFTAANAWFKGAAAGGVPWNQLLAALATLV